MLELTWCPVLLQVQELHGKADLLKVSRTVDLVYKRA